MWYVIYNEIILISNFIIRYLSFLSLIVSPQEQLADENKYCDALEKKCKDGNKKACDLDEKKFKKLNEIM